MDTLSDVMYSSNAMPNILYHVLCHDLLAKNHRIPQFLYSMEPLLFILRTVSINPFVFCLFVTVSLKVKLK